MPRRFAAILALVAAIRPTAADDLPATRIPWTTSRITGSPEPPSPYRVERLWPHLAFDQPVEMIPYPDGKRCVVVERKGPIKLFDDRQDASETHLLLDAAQAIPGLTAVYGLAFHPDFETNRLCYVCYILAADLPDGTHVSEFRVADEEPPRIDPAGERLLISWRSGGHNGGSLKFGPDRCLYISAGDAGPADPPDPRRTGQDLSDLPSSVLRIDVDRRDGDLPYAVPADNPFVGTAGARPENWAYGFRNPWRMSFDRATGDLWLGDVGWQLWELVFRVEKGANYGWSVMEGPQPVRTEGGRGPTPIVPPLHALPRADAASVTGGFVYHGERLTELRGAYIYGDYVTGKVWSLRHDGERVTEHVELVDTPIAIICFYEGPDGELALLDYNAGTIHRLVPNVVDPARTQEFPRKLSETGLFSSTAAQVPAPGVVPFSINAGQWMDHAVAERFVAVPGSGAMKLARSKGSVPTGSVFPADSVLVKTISLDLERGRPATRRRIETQVLHYVEEPHKTNAGEWFGYTYLWNADQTDADLVPSSGAQLEFDVVDPAAPGGRLKQPWRVASRAECYLCHNPWAGYRLAFNEPQLTGAPCDGAEDQLALLKRIGLVTIEDGSGPAAAGNKGKPGKPLPMTPLVDPRDESAPLADRALSYLHVNCAHCHRTGGGGTSLMLLERQLPLESRRMLGERPSQGTFNIAHPALVQPGDACGSVLFYRMAKLGRGRMPHIGSQLVDEPGLDLVYEWIEGMSGERRGESGGTSQGEDAISAAWRDKRQAQALVDQYLSAASSQSEAATALTSVFASTRAAILLERAVSQGRASPPLREQIVQAAAGHGDPIIRELFERFLPDEQRVKRLGASVTPDAILAMTGDAERGRRLYAETTGMQCRNCHRVGESGLAVGPDLTAIARQRTRAELLESILDPSRKIEPQFVAYVVETKAGQVHTGLLVERTPERVTLRAADNKTIDVPAAEIEQLVPQARSLMPDLLYRDLTADQLADLLAYLDSLR